MKDAGMTLFDRLTKNGNGCLKEALRAADCPPEEACGWLRRTDAIPLLALAAAGAGVKAPAMGLADEFLAQAVRGICQRSEVSCTSVTEAQVLDLLKAALLQGPPEPAHVLADPEVRKVILNALAARVAEETDLPTADALRAGQLIVDGVMFEDVAGVTARTVRVMRRLPPALVRFLHRPDRLIAVLPAFGRDMLTLPAETAGLAWDLAADLLAGKETMVIDEPERFPLLDHTFGAIYASVPPAGELRAWLVDLLAYESVQLAIIIYARTQGISLTSADIVALRAAIAEGSLTPALAQAVTRLQQQADWKGRLIKRLKAMAK